MTSQTLMRIPVQLTLEQHDFLRRRAFDRRTSIAALIRDLVEERRQLEEPQLELPLVPEPSPVSRERA
jgi:hypothetical protein